MPSRSIAPPRLPSPPTTLDPEAQRYLGDLVRALEAYIEIDQNPGEFRATKGTLTNLPTSSTDLEDGALWNDSGTVKIVYTP